MADRVITATEMRMLADLGRDHITPLVRRCIDEAMDELGRDETSGKAYELAELTAKKALRKMAESMVDMRPIAERILAEQQRNLPPGYTPA